MPLNLKLPPQLAGVFPLLAMIFFVAVVIVHIGFAVAVAVDANGLKRERSGPLIAGPLLWALATLLGGVYVAAVYWLIHHSALSRR